MVSRRAFLRSSACAIAVAGGGLVGARLSAQDRFDQDALLAFYNLGQITLLHMGDIHGQITPHFRRPAARRIEPPSVTGEGFRIRYGIGGRSPMDYAFTHENFAIHAETYGPIGGLDHAATLLRAIRAQRPGSLFLTQAMGEGLGTSGEVTAQVLAAMAPDVLAQGDARLIAPQQGGGAIPHTLFEREGVPIAILAHDQNLPQMQVQVDRLRDEGAQLVVCLSAHGLAAGRHLAGGVSGIDVILLNGSHDALPEPETLNDCHIIASGTQGRFVARIDLAVEEGKLTEVRHRLIPVFSDLIAPDPGIAAAIQILRDPFKEELEEVIGHADHLLYKRDSVDSTWDDVICEALMAEYEADVALSPGTRWGRSILPGQAITRQDVGAVCGWAGANAGVKEMSGAQIKELLGQAAERLIAQDAQFREEFDMPRLGGVSYQLSVKANNGKRISDLRLLSTGAEIEDDQPLRVASWAVQGTQGDGTAMAEILERFIRRKTRVGSPPSERVNVK